MTRTETMQGGKTYGTIRAPPHFLKIELLHPLFVRGDGRTFDADTVFDDCVCSIDSHLVICLPKCKR